MVEGKGREGEREEGHGRREGKGGREEGHGRREGEGEREEGHGGREGKGEREEGHGGREGREGGGAWLYNGCGLRWSEISFLSPLDLYWSKWHPKCPRT